MFFPIFRRAHPDFFGEIGTLDTRRGQEPRCVPLLFLGSLLGTRWPIFSPVLINSSRRLFESFLLVSKVQPIQTATIHCFFPFSWLLVLFLHSFSVDFWSIWGAKKTSFLALHHLNGGEFRCRLQIFKRSFSRTGAKVSNLIPSDWRDASKPSF